MATNHIPGDLVGIFISTVLVSPLTADWKEIVCGMNIGVDGSKDVNKKRTKCGQIATAGPAGWTITGTGTHNTAPGTNQISADELIGIFQGTADILVKVVHATDTSLIYRQGQGVLSKYTESIDAGDSAEFDFSIDISGNLDITP